MRPTVEISMLFPARWQAWEHSKRVYRFEDVAEEAVTALSRGSEVSLQKRKILELLKTAARACMVSVREIGCDGCAVFRQAAETEQVALAFLPDDVHVMDITVFATDTLGTSSVRALGMWPPDCS